MKVAILAGGLGTRLSEETVVKPKPMVEVGDHPIIWHIMKHYAHFGMNDFYVALGYKGDVIKRYFLDYFTLNGSMTLNLATGELERHQNACEDWRVNLIDTGLEANTGDRLRHMRSWLSEETFMLTYGDGVSSVDVADLLRFHKAHGLLATVTAVRPPARFGELVIGDIAVEEFSEKSQVGQGWINGGFMVLEPEVLDRIEENGTVSFEASVLDSLAAEGQLAAYRHDGFWQCMDTLRDKRLLDGLWDQGKAPWKVWA
ncbi:MAG TPA: glucose-1-phosphate cytidylyltransferase [Chloroflexota bacterium]|jgi:glucose-1-phosphate cytidylyltransferase|nr:glucose-1-phosphate cytidylyltransferase [Chloroflexota bacterium]